MFLRVRHFEPVFSIIAALNLILKGFVEVGKDTRRTKLRKESEAISPKKI